MPTFTMPKSFDDIATAQPLPEGIYRFVSCAEPRVEENKARTGMNLILEIMTIGETDPALNGRTFMKWISLPTAQDADRRTKRGQTFLDFKMERLRVAVEAIGGRCNGADIEIPPQFECRWAVIQKLNQDTQAIENELDDDPIHA